VLRVEVDLFDGSKRVGSGFLTELEGKNFILTNRHVVDRAIRLRIGVTESALEDVPSYQVSQKYDLAMIEPPPGMKAKSLELRMEPAKVGERIYVIGFPLGLAKSITQGIISSSYPEAFQFDASISSGNSGGPVLDTRGRVLGIATQGSLAPGNGVVVQNLNFAIPSTVLPESRKFISPVCDFFWAWSKLARLNRKEVELLKGSKVIELNLLATTLLYLATQDPNQAQVDTALERARIALRLDGVDIVSDANEAAHRLRAQVPVFNLVHLWFAQSAEDPLFAQWLETMGEQGFGVHMVASDLERLLRVSFEHTKADYEGLAFRLEFLAKYYSELVRPPEPETNAMIETAAELEGTTRTRRDFVKDLSKGC